MQELLWTLLEFMLSVIGALEKGKKKMHALKWISLINWIDKLQKIFSEIISRKMQQRSKKSLIE